MQIRFLTPINIFAQRISFQSICVKIRTTFSGVSSVEQQGTKSDYYCEEFSIEERTTKTTNNCESSVLSSSSKSLSIKSENHRMPVVAAVVAHRRIYPAAASTLANSTAGSKRSSCAVRLSALNLAPPPLALTGVNKKSSHNNNKYSSSGGTFTTASGGGGINGKPNSRPLVELKQLSHLLSPAPIKGSAAILAECRRYYAKGMDKPKTKKAKVVVNENEMAEVIDVNNFKKQLEKLVELMKEDFTNQLSIRGAAGALESLQVEFDGETYPLQELAQVGRKNPQLAVLNLASLPDAIKPVLKAIEESGMNLNPQQEGTTIYIPLPKVTREHRETLAKNAKALFVKHKTLMQGVQNKYVKQCKGQKDMSDDLLFSVQQQIMLYTNNVIAEAEKLMQLKQKELLENK